MSTEIYYCKNEEDLKRVSLHIFNEALDRYGVEIALMRSHIQYCDYAQDQEQDYDITCADCDIDECLLFVHQDDKDVRKHFEIEQVDCVLPCIVCIDDDDITNYCSVEKSKNNTKNSCRNEWL